MAQLRRVCTPIGEISDQVKVVKMTTINDPTLVITYFFNGTEEYEPAVTRQLSDIFDTLVDRLELHDPFTPSMSSTDQHYLTFFRYVWNRERRAMLSQFLIGPSQVQCIQLVLPVSAKKADFSIAEAVDAWQQIEADLSEWLRGVSDEEERSVGSDKIYWGCSRLYFTVADSLVGTSDEAIDVAKSVQGLQLDEADQMVEPSINSRPAVVRLQPYLPQGHARDFGTLWRLNEPATDSRTYRSAWLLISPQAQDDAVTGNYILNGRFAVGESYLCKAHNQAGMYSWATRNLKNDLRLVREETQELLALKGPESFEAAELEQARSELRRMGKRINSVAVVYSKLLFLLSEIDRLHLTVRTNLDNFGNMAEAFPFWEHPAAQLEVLRLRGVLRQIEHDQRSRRASLQGFQTAIETVRARLDLIDDELAVVRLSAEHMEAEKAEERGAFIAVLGIVLGISQVVVLTTQQLWAMLLLSALPMLGFLVWWLIRAIKRHEK